MGRAVKAGPPAKGLPRECGRETAMAWLGTARGDGEEDLGYVFVGEAGSTC